MTDYTTLHESSKPIAHLIDLFLFKGAPVNTDQDHPVTVLINHGYVAGFAPTRLQPLWSAYRVANASRSVDYDRPHLYYADERLEDSERLDNSTFGSSGGVQYHVGHMVPNEVINVQFGRLAQMETFFMSNMCPQRGTLNGGVWLKLENAIRNIEDQPRQRDHVWAVVGPVFGNSSDTIRRSDGKRVPIPEAFYCITIDPFSYPWDRPGNAQIACFLIPQDAPRTKSPIDFLTDLDEIQARTKLEFMPGWSQQVTRSSALAGVQGVQHRLLAQF